MTVPFQVPCFLVAEDMKSTTRRTDSELCRDASPRAVEVNKGMASQIPKIQDSFGGPLGNFRPV